MKTIVSTLMLAAALTASATTKTLTVTVNNPTKQPSIQIPIVVPLGQYGLTVSQATVKCKDGVLASQLDDLDHDGTPDELCFMVGLNAKQTLTFEVVLSDEGSQPAYPAKTHAQMVMRNSKVKEKNKHNILIGSLTEERGSASLFGLVHSHGPIFENEYCGFRIYFDHRQTVDLYGKARKGLELKDTQFYPSKEQKEAGYGDDVLWVGNSYGLGALRGWDGERQTMFDDLDHRTMSVVATGPVRSIVEVTDSRWNTRNAGKKPITMTTRYTVWAGRRDCGVDIRFAQPAKGYDFATGLVNVDGSTEFTDHKGLRGCWGTAWPALGKDTLTLQRETVGLAICIPSAYIKKEMPADKENYTYVVGVDKENELHYNICFTSAREQGFGYEGAQAWFDYLKQWKEMLETTQKVTVTIR